MGRIEAEITLPVHHSGLKAYEGGSKPKDDVDNG